MSFYDEYPIPMEKRVLDRQRLGATVAQSVRVEVEPDFIRGQLLHRMTAEILADKIASDTYSESKEVSWPDSTWQMFKSHHTDSWWLGWLVRRHPVRLHTEHLTVEVHVERYLRYPEASLNIPELGNPVIWEQAKQTRS